MTDHTPTDLPAPVIGTIEHVLGAKVETEVLEGIVSSIGGPALGPYRKLLWQLAAPASALLLAVLSGHVSLVQILTIAVGFLGAIAVYRIPNGDTGAWKVGKGIAAFASAAVQALVVLLVGGLAIGDVQPDQWLGVVTQALAAIGLLVAPNDPVPDDLQLEQDPAALPAASR